LNPKEEGNLVIPYEEFISELWQGKWM